MKYEFSKRMSSIKGSAIREMFKLASDGSFISLAGGNPAPETFPNNELSEIAQELLTKNPVLSLQYGVTEGYAPLRELVKERLTKKENIDFTDNNLIIVSGGQQGIALTVKSLVNEGDTVIVEEPSFIGATNAFRSNGANLVGVPLDDDGINIELLEKAVKENHNTKILYLIPTYQNPSGKTMSLAKRKRVYEIAKENNIVIIEDNPYGELGFTDEKIPTIKSFDDDGVVVYCGSFSKIVAPGLRVGFVVGGEELIDKMVVAKQVSDVHTSILPQLLIYEYMKRYNLDENIKKSAELYSHKCSVMINAIKKYFPPEVKYTVPKGGLFIWCDAGEGVDASKLVKMCIENKLVIVPGNNFMVDMNKTTSCFRLNYSTMSDEKIEKGIEILGNILKNYK